MSVDQGETWNMAQLPPVGHEQFYSILAANDEMVFMHVDEPGGQSVQQLRDVSHHTVYPSTDATEEADIVFFLVEKMSLVDS